MRTKICRMYFGIAETRSATFRSPGHSTFRCRSLNGKHDIYRDLQSQTCTQSDLRARRAISNRAPATPDMQPFSSKAHCTGARNQIKTPTLRSPYTYSKRNPSDFEQRKPTKFTFNANWKLIITLYDSNKWR